jgi:hypothetical protein
LSSLDLPRDDPEVLEGVEGRTATPNLSRVRGSTAFSPAWQFDERHATRIAAPPERVFAAIHAVTAREIRFFRLLTSIRRGGRSQGENILDAPSDVPLVDVALRGGFVLLADDAPRELVIGTVVVAPRSGFDRSALDADWYTRLSRPGFAKATMNFLVEADGRGGSLLSTETRVYATDARARRRFAVYWRLIYPGSALIRRMWLRAIRVRAEAADRRAGFKSKIAEPVSLRRSRSRFQR